MTMSKKLSEYIRKKLFVIYTIYHKKLFATLNFRKLFVTTSNYKDQFNNL